MKRGKHYIFIAVCALLTACNTSDEPAGAPVSFATDVSPQTREYSSVDMLTNMGVFTFFTPGNWTDHIADATPDYMYNQPVTKDTGTGTWTYSPVMYWPVRDTDKLSFFAYAPYADEKTAGSSPTVSAQTVPGYPTLTYTLPPDETTEPIDLLTASLLNQSNSGSPVRFTLKHALTKIHILIKNADSDGTMKTITRLSLTSRSSGTLTYTADGISWTTSADNPRIYSFIPTEAPLILAQDYGAEVDAGSTLALPELTGATVSVVYNMIVDGVDTEITITDRTLPDTSAWTPGSIITYAIWLKKERLNIVADGSAWTADGEDEAIIINPPTEPAY